MRRPFIIKLNYRFYIMPLLLVLCLFSHALAQEPVNLCEDEVKPQVKKSMDRSVKISGRIQTWLRFTELNPGSKVYETERSHLIDFSVRRYRINIEGNVDENIKYVIMLGNNNLSYWNRENIGVSLLEAYVDYQVNPHLGIGAGKHGWTGLSRYSASSSISPLVMDNEFISKPFINVYDDLLRRLGVYARGAHKKWDYLVTLSMPYYFKNNGIGSTIGEHATFSDRYPMYQFSAYVKYQFLDKENQDNPWTSGTYLGKKNVLNIGIGNLFQPNTTWYLNGQDTVYNNVSALAADLFYERPIKNNRAVTFYMACFLYDFGRNFVRNIGINNPAPGITAPEYFNGGGSAFPTVGTGNIMFMQLGYLRPVDSANKMQMQPFYMLSYGRLEALSDPVVYWNTGLSYYLNGQRSKISVRYENRPVYQRTEAGILETDKKGMVVMQYQMLF